MRHALLLAGVHPDAVAQLPLDVAMRMKDAAARRPEVAAFLSENEGLVPITEAELNALQDASDEDAWAAFDDTEDAHE